MSNPIWVYDLTIKAENYSIALVKEVFKSIAKKWVFQLEEGKGGFRHYQCRINLRERKRLKELVTDMHQHGVTEMKVSPTHKSNKQRWTYVMKEDTRQDGPWSDRDMNLPPRLQVTLDNPKPWQSKLDTFGKDDRKIHFVVDLAGNSGKTTYALARAAKDPLCLYVKMTSSVEQIEQALFAKLAEYEAFQSITVFINIPRTHSMNEKEKARLANLLETIKDGHVTEFRYKYQEAWINLSKVVVFTNEDLQIRNKLSADRPVFWHIENGNLRQG